MKSLLALALSFMFAACSTPQSEPAPTGNSWIALFNGHNLDGWTPKFAGYELGHNLNNTFRVEDSLLRVSYEGYDTFSNEFGHLFYESPFSHYVLRLEYRFEGKQAPGGASWAYKNSGAMLHSQPPATMGLEQAFPVSLEAQLLGGDEAGSRPTANLCTPGTHVYLADTLTTAHCINAEGPTFRGEEWVTIDLVVLGDSIIHHVVGNDTVLTYTRPHIGGDFIPDGYAVKEGSPLSEGYICLQAESHPLSFRRVELLPLKAD
ncbi:DUF1080 domain-containing protein [Phaeodactylibacter luteus]|uniref:DUF1080 domain-containing protein n=2 Tax=Phaeodactylibacter luteus TaxID=1564516 RepID=A0A5C6RYJ5_9BACT|nr:DUF1080 domain-containing protein [Phaeodactylibacter luteus]